MKWIVKCPAPTDSRQQKWGDFHFARSLAKQLVLRGQEVLIQYQPEWSDGEDEADVVLLLRGKYAYQPRNREALHVAWHLSHPEDVSAQEIRDYDLFAVASVSHADRLAASHGSRIIALPQCTDADEFNSRLSQSASERRDVVFVGNSREVERWCVIEYLRLGFPLRIWGRGWNHWPEAQRVVVADYLPNEDLGRFYGGARATLNDHWPDMREHGFINNRIYDAIACGLPVITDSHPDLLRRFGHAVIAYQAGGSLQEALTRYVLDYPRVFDAVQREAENVTREDSFSVRAMHLLEQVELRISARSSSTGTAPPEVDAWAEVGSASAFAPEHTSETGAESLQPTVETPPRFPPELRIGQVNGETPIEVPAGFAPPPSNFCAVCESQVEDFLPGGVVHVRARARCPKCGVLERHRLMALYLRSHTPLFDGTPRSLLHVAPEPPIAAILRALPGVDYLSADLMSPEAMVRMDLTDIRYPNHFFDAIICSHVLEHIPDDGQAMREMYRVLKPGGVVVVQVPIYGETTYEDFSVNSDEDRLRLFGQRDHVRKYGRDIARRLADSGFDVRLMTMPEDSKLAKRLGLKPAPIFDCTKPATPAGARSVGLESHS